MAHVSNPQPSRKNAGPVAAPLLRRLNRYKAFRPKLAEDGECFKPGRIYIAPPDNHLLVKKDKMLVTKGACETNTDQESIRCFDLPPWRIARA